MLLVPDERSTVKIGEGPKVEEVYLSGADPRDPAKFSAKIGGH